MALDISTLVYAEFAYLKIGSSGNLADHAQAMGGISESLVTQPITAINSRNTQQAGRQITRMINFSLYGTTDIRDLFRGTGGAGIIGSEAAVEFQYAAEAHATPGTATVTTPVVVAERCLVTGPGRFPGGSVETPTLYVCSWQINGDVTLKTS